MQVIQQVMSEKMRLPFRTHPKHRLKHNGPENFGFD